MERNRIQEFFELPEQDTPSRLGADDATTARPASSFVAIPHAIWAELGGDQRLQFTSMYQQAFLRAEEQLRRECVERLLESIVAR
jgi:hypothetical protein